MEPIKIKFTHIELQLATSFIAYCSVNNVEVSQLENDGENYIISIEKSNVIRLSDYLLADNDSKSMNRIIKSML